MRTQPPFDALPCPASSGHPDRQSFRCQAPLLSLLVSVVQRIPTDTRTCGDLPHSTTLTQQMALRGSRDKNDHRRSRSPEEPRQVIKQGRPSNRAGHQAGQATEQGRPPNRAGHQTGYATEQGRPPNRAGNGTGQATEQGGPSNRAGHRPALPPRTKGAEAVIKNTAGKKRRNTTNPYDTIHITSIDKISRRGRQVLFGARGARGHFSKLRRPAMTILFRTTAANLFTTNISPPLPSPPLPIPL